MEKKKGIIITTIVVLLLLVVGVTYAFFTYESGTKSDIVTGQIYMNYEETSTISLTGVFPETKEQALKRTTDENGVFEFTITGRNTSKYPVYYEIDLLEGGVVTGKTEQSTKIAPDDVRIYLERDGEVLVDGVTYKDWNNRRIYVDIVPANQTSNIEHKYVLCMWIDENVTISDTDPDADYTTSEWNDAYTSLKVRVVGDFEEKEVTTDASCFAYNVITPDGYVTYDYLTELTLDTSEEKVEACMAIQMDNYGEDLSTAQDGYQSFCEGTGMVDDYGHLFDLKGYSASWYRDGGTLEEIQEFYPVVSNITSETRYYELNTSEESVNACMEYMLNDTGGSDRSDAQDGYQSFCEGTGTIIDKETIFSDFVISYFGYALIERNVFTQVEEIPQVIEITDYDESCGLDVVIPSTIEDLPVTRIADGTYDRYGYVDGGIFSHLNLTSIKLPKTVKYIGAGAFMNNNLAEIAIPNTVNYIGDLAFGINKLTEVIIPESVTYIGNQAFSLNQLINISVSGNPTLGASSFYVNGGGIQTFQYGGTCAELNQYEHVLSGDYDRPTIITSDTNSCEYTKYSYAPQ